MRRIVIVIAAIILAAGCDGESYPPEVVENFMSACTSQPGATEAACSCVIERIQEDMSLEEYTEAEAQMESGNVPAELQTIVEDCASA